MSDSILFPGRFQVLGHDNQPACVVPELLTPYYLFPVSI